MPLATAATGIGKQVVTHAVRTWLGARRERTERDAELVDLVRISVRDRQSSPAFPDACAPGGRPVPPQIPNSEVHHGR